MEFPLETRVWARELKEQIKQAAHALKHPDQKVKLPDIPLAPKKGDIISTFSLKELLQAEARFIPDDVLADKKMVAQLIYKHLPHRYGFEEALRTGVYFPYPHELSQVICPTQMLVNYVVAKECGLKPVIKELNSFRSKGHTFIANHALIEVDVGDDQPWVLDQQWQILGPITWDVAHKRLSVRNRLDKKDLEDDDDDQQKECEYGVVETFSEDDYIKRIQFYRSPEYAAAMLIAGQRVGWPKADAWRSTQPLAAEWCIRYYPNEHKLSSMIHFPRTLVQNRGLENVLLFDDKGEVVHEEIRGCFYRTHGWAAFVHAVPMLVISIADADKLREGLTEFKLEQHVALEKSMYENILAGETSTQFEEVVKASYERLKSMPSFSAAKKFIMTEALYQNARRQARRDYLYTEFERLNAFDVFPQGSVLVGNVLDQQKQLEKIKRRIKQREAAMAAGRQVFHRGQWRYVLDTRRLEYDHVREYLNLQNSRELSVYQLEQRTKYCHESADRVCYAKDVIQKNATTVQDLEVFAKQQLGDNIEKHFLAAYGRMFAEFMVLIAHGWNQLRLSGYQEKVIEKIKKYQA